MPYYKKDYLYRELKRAWFYTFNYLVLLYDRANPNSRILLYKNQYNKIKDNIVGIKKASN